MIIELSDEYIPKEILHREKEIKEIRDVFTNFKQIQMGTNLAVLGVTGAGKTVIIKSIQEEENNSIYIDCNETKTAFRTLMKICGKKVKTRSEILSKTIEALKENPRIIILDEIDKVSDFTDLMNDLNTIYRKTMIPIIIVTLKRDVVESMPSDVRKTLFFKKISLASYNADELRSILQSRLDSMEITFDELDVGKISYLCATSAKQGSARVMINILIRCIQSQNFSQRFIEKTNEDLMKEDWIGFINDINNTERKFLGILLDYCDDKKEIPSDFLQGKMELSGARISQLINIFEKYSVVSSRHENYGRGTGRKRMIRFCNKDVHSEINKALGI